MNSETLRKTPFHPLQHTQLLRSVRALKKPNWGAMTDGERLLHACLMTYVKHHMGIDICGWDKLDDILHDAICQNVSDDNFCRWSDMINAEELPPT